MAEARIVTTPIEVATLEAQAGRAEHGAICVFIGQTRNNARGRQVAYLEYDAYIPMAEKVLLKIAEEAETRWGCQVIVHHRIGRVEIGEASVAVIVASPHRGEAFEACRYCIDTLKQEVPIWKRETCPDGTYWIEGETTVPVATE